MSSYWAQYSAVPRFGRWRRATLSMARILLVDPSETARRAMQGILARGDHRFAAVDDPAAAWAFLRRNPGVDLLFTDLQLPSASHGIGLVKRLRTDPWFRHLPVVVYTGHGDRDSVRLAVQLRVQNFLVKPYHDDDIFAEIDKAEANPWRRRFFARPPAGDGAPPSLPDLLRELELARDPMGSFAELQDFRPVADLLLPLRLRAEAGGALGLAEALTALSAAANDERWSLWPDRLEQLDYALLLIAGQLEPSQGASPDFYTEAERVTAVEARERARWLAAPAAGRCPVVAWEQIQRQIDGLRGCPVIDTVAAGFQMIANGHPSCINPLMDLVARDPGLSAQMLIAANLAHPPSEATGRIEDARLAVGQLGELRLEAQARQLVVAAERIMDVPPDFTWPRFWTFQRGVARIAQTLCHELEFSSLEPVARVAGQLHDLGKLLLAHLQPAGFQAILTHAPRHGQSLRDTERLFLGGTTAQMAAQFAERFGLSQRLANVMRWVDDPAAATEDAHLVAIVSLARHLCRVNRVGASGDPLSGRPEPLEETPAWRILREGLYPSFNPAKFAVQMHAHCERLRHEFSGHQGGTVADLARRASS